MAEPGPRELNSGNTAIVRGNGSHAIAGPGNRNLARVFGNGSTARAAGEGRRVTSVGDNVHNPPKDEK
jgi:hypothetical protein